VISKPPKANRAVQAQAWLLELLQADKEAFAAGDWERLDRIRLSIDAVRDELRAAGVTRPAEL
jgi:hypothetical protein